MRGGVARATLHRTSFHATEHPKYVDVLPIDIPAALRDRYPDFFAPHCDDGEFFNPWRSRDNASFGDMLKWQFSKNPWKGEKKKEEPVEPDRDGLDQFRASDAALKSIWLGHASFLIELDGWKGLVDPVYGTVGAFVKRFGEEPYPIEDLPSVDAVFLTHGHYDHLDVQTLRRVAEVNPDATFLSPLGQARYIPSEAGDVTELDWWERVDFGGIEAHFVPAQHWHRRGVFDQNRALWGGWVFRGSRTAFHCGDSGYCDLFSLLGELYDIDLAFLPAGAYEPRWFMKVQHMNPAEAVQSFRDLRADRFAAMHWGTYDLTDEPLNKGAEVVAEEARTAGVESALRLPRPGGFVNG